MKAPIDTFISNAFSHADTARNYAPTAFLLNSIAWETDSEFEPAADRCSLREADARVDVPDAAACAGAGRSELVADVHEQPAIEIPLIRMTVRQAA